MISFAEVDALLAYDPNAGSLKWKTNGFRRVTGDDAGVVRLGYRYVTIDGREYMGGRLAWLLTHGEWPATRVRFRNSDGADIRLENLYVDAFKWQTRERKNEKNREFRKAQPDLVKSQELKKDFGITLEQYVAMLADQDGVCAICHRPETAIRLGKLKMLCVDHNHTTGEVRGLLCHECNLGIGKLGDDPDRIVKAADYIRKHAGKVVPLRKENTA